MVETCRFDTAAGHAGADPQVRSERDQDARSHHLFDPAGNRALRDFPFDFGFTGRDVMTAFPFKVKVLFGGGNVTVR